MLEGLGAENDQYRIQKIDYQLQLIYIAKLSCAWDLTRVIVWHDCSSHDWKIHDFGHNC